MLGFFLSLHHPPCVCGFELRWAQVVLDTVANYEGVTCIKDCWRTVRAFALSKRKGGERAECCDESVDDAARGSGIAEWRRDSAFRVPASAFHIRMSVVLVCCCVTKEGDSAASLVCMPALHSRLLCSLWGH